MTCFTSCLMAIMHPQDYTVDPAVLYRIKLPKLTSLSFCYLIYFIYRLPLPPPSFTLSFNSMVCMLISLKYWTTKHLFFSHSFYHFILFFPLSPLPIITKRFHSLCVFNNSLFLDLFFNFCPFSM